MNLTREQAIDRSIELWEYLAETGDWGKSSWPRWKEFGRIDADCFLCEYNGREADKTGLRICTRCPYYQSYGYCIKEGSPFMLWEEWEDRKANKKYAALFLEQLKELKK